MYNFQDALNQLKTALDQSITARLAYKRAHAMGVLSADGKNAESRSAQADMHSFEQLQAYEQAKANEAVARALVDYLIARGASLPAGAVE